MAQEKRGIEESLAKISYFTALSEAEQKKLASLFREKKARRGKVIFYEGDSPDFLYLVKEGKVKVSKLSPEGKITVLEVIPEGQTFGEVAVFDGQPFPATAEAMTDSTILYMDRQDFLKFVRSNPQVAEAIIADLGTRLRFAQKLVHSLATERAERRLATAVLKLADKLEVKSSEGTTIDLPLTRQDLAEMAGVALETAIRIVSRWQKNNLVVFEKKYLTVKDLPSLRELAES